MRPSAELRVPIVLESNESDDRQRTPRCPIEMEAPKCPTVYRLDTTESLYVTESATGVRREPTKAVEGCETNVAS